MRIEDIDVQPFVHMFGAESAKITKPLDTMYLTVKMRRNIKNADEVGKIFPGCETSYTEDVVMANGATMRELADKAISMRDLMRKGGLLPPYDPAIDAKPTPCAYRIMMAERAGESVKRPARGSEVFLAAVVYTLSAVVLAGFGWQIGKLFK